MKIIANLRGFCFNCGRDRGPTIICQCCGWADPKTIKNKEEAKKLSEKYDAKKKRKVNCNE